jgi:hypothetical protein
MILDGLACQTEVSRCREHVAVIGPHSRFSDFVCRRKMDCVGGADEEIAGSGNHLRTGPSQQSFIDGNEVPQTVFYVFGEAYSKFARIAARRGAFTYAAMKYGMELGQGPERRMDHICFSDKLANLRVH